MARTSLVDNVVDLVISKIVDGTISPGGAIPTETELAEQADVSRMTVREAIKVLRGRGVIEVRRGVGTFLAEPRDWTDIETVMRVAVAGMGYRSASEQLIELRAVIEVNAAELAAVRRSRTDVARMRELIGEMRASHASGDVDAFVRHDIDFHDVVLAATDNVFLPVVLRSLGKLLYSGRHQTSEVAVIREHAIEFHVGVCDAIERGDATGAQAMMKSHMDQTMHDLKRHVLGIGSADGRDFERAAPPA
ncbi:FadR/GntR family transcriptional regulator [Galbitalea sp. SE-J8]|uniref:FadR/GntR family transcriptional regulator n=1 Tax=Galbitalea sp. SE-J8 TaxID=3054952 RepID=UPI00259CD6C4|nr:FadR/GntR family transcriptional regulator [Galbitalea sp. SE-J8]MDM4763005.1 FadR/GntR family transcriptional regulator [Galbitalea sp. SE-J8]